MSAPAWQWPSGAGLDARWLALWHTFEATESGRALREYLHARAAAGARIVPAQPLHALELTPLEAVRVVILGQDPYHGENQAHGLAFSVPDGVAIPPSLRNVYAEVGCDIGAAPPASPNLERWARQGVLLLNTILTVERDTPAAHANRGWEQFTLDVIREAADDPAPKVFMLWGAYAQRLADTIAAFGAHHCVLLANHPSPLSARRPPVPFLGCGHFSRANAFLHSKGRGAIVWNENSS